LCPHATTQVPHQAPHHRDRPLTASRSRAEPASAKEHLVQLLLLGDDRHPAWSTLEAHATRSGDFADLPRATPAERVVVLLGYEQLAGLDALTARLSPALAEQGVGLLVVAPDLSDACSAGRSLTAARAALPRATWLSHAPPIEALLAVSEELRVTRTLSLSWGEQPVPLVSWDDVAEAVLRWCANPAPPATELRVAGPEAFTGEALAGVFTDLLAAVLEPDRFLALRLRELDADGDGTVTTDEAAAFLETLGYAPAAAADLALAADLNGDGTLDVDEFRFGLDHQLAQALAELPRGVQWHRTLPHLLRDRWVSRGWAFSAANALAEHLQFTRSQSEAATWTGGRRVADVLAPHTLALVDVFVLPGRGLLTRAEGRFGDASPRAPELLWQPGDPQLDHPAAFSHIATSDGLHLDTRRGPGGAVEARWRSNGATEVLRFGEGDEARALELSDGHLVGVACRGWWSGLRDTMVDLRARRAIRPWERALFRELGALHLAHVEEVVDPQEVICHCVNATRKRLVEAVDAGAATLTAIAERTRATSVCGGCTPIVEELLGSPKLKVAAVHAIERLGHDFVTVTLAPVDAEPTPSKAGQHVVVQARIKDRWVTRAYTLTSPGGVAVPYEITVKREEMGLFSRWLCDRAAADSLFRCSAPTGHVFLADDDAGPITVFCGGVGVTPAIALARTLATDGTGRRLHIEWSARRPTDFIFAEELDALGAAHEHITSRRRCTSTDNRLTGAEVRERFPYTPGAVAFVCGPDKFGTDLKGFLRCAGWPDDAVRLEVFSSKVDDEGNVQRTQRDDPAASPPELDDAGVAIVPPIQHTSFFLDTRESRPVLLEAEAFLGQMYRERGLGAVLAPRLAEVRAEVEQTGTYVHTPDELTFGARLAWRNATRCVGRFFWNHLVVRDMRHLEREEDIFAAVVDHLRMATNDGDLVSTMTVFRPGAPDIRLYNTQLLRYAGYVQADGSIVGDPANVELTEQALALGWRGPGTRFDILPIILRIGDRPARYFDIPEDAILRVPIEHPHYTWFADLGLQWYALPAVSEIALDLGGVAYRCVPFNGFYMGTEIGARNLSDTNRYNQLPLIAARLGLDTTSSATLWKDRALVELNIAVMHSFQKRRVRILDHHATCDYFLEFERQERIAGRAVYADWSWLVPPMSGSTSPIWLRNDLRNVVYKPMYGYQAHAWKPDGPPPDHEGPIPPCPHLRGRR
jgi:nitric-oxide synthase